MASRFILPFGLIALVSACSITDSISYQDGEGQIPESLFDDIQHKRVSTQYVVDRLGQPVLTEMLGEDIRVMTYRFSRVQIRNWRMLLILHSGRRAEDITYYHVVYKDDEIRKSWLDDNLRIQDHHKLVQKIEPKEKNKSSSGFQWKIPFFNKQDKVEQVASNTGNANSTNNANSANNAKSMNKDASNMDSSKAEKQQSSMQESSMQNSPMQNNPDQSHNGSSDNATQVQEPEVNERALKVDLDL